MFDPHIEAALGQEDVWDAITDHIVCTAVYLDGTIEPVPVITDDGTDAAQFQFHHLHMDGVICPACGNESLRISFKASEGITDAQLFGDGDDEPWFLFEQLERLECTKGCEPAAILTALGLPSEWCLTDDGLLNRIAAFVRSYIVVTPAQAVALALWVAHTHTIEAADVTPYVHIRSAEKQCGKTNLIHALGTLVSKPINTANISVAALFRSLGDTPPPTVLYDEIDTIFGPQARGDEDMRGLLNAGYVRGATFIRIVGEGSKMQPQTFNIFSAKAFAGIGELPDTLEDRSIPIVLRKKTAEERVDRFRRRSVTKVAAPIRAALEKWAEKATEALADAYPELPEELGDRDQDIWEPLLAIADYVGGHWPQRARAAALELCADKADEEASTGVRLLAAIRTVFDGLASDSLFDEEPADRISSSALLDTLHADTEGGWAEWLTVRKLARYLGHYGIKSRSVRLPDGSTPKGYHREQFEDAWSRYLPLPGAESATTPQPAWLSQKWLESITPSEPLSATAQTRMVEPKTDTCGGVADRNATRGVGSDPEAEAALASVVVTGAELLAWADAGKPLPATSAELRRKLDAESDDDAEA